MIRVVDKNDTGKTRKLLEECSKDPLGVFVCRRPESAKEKCIAYWIPMVKCVSYTEFINGDKEAYSDKHLYIDELEKFVLSMPFNVSGYSLTV